MTSASMKQGWFPNVLAPLHVFEQLRYSRYSESQFQMSLCLLSSKFLTLSRVTCQSCFVICGAAVAPSLIGSIEPDPML